MSGNNGVQNVASTGAALVWAFLAGPIFLIPAVAQASSGIELVGLAIFQGFVVVVIGVLS